MNEEDEVSIGMAYKHRRLRPWMCHALAGQYVKAAEAVEMEDDFSPVHHFLCCMSIELALKAFLLTKGLPVSKLKKVGHDLEKGLEVAELRGLSAIVEIEDGYKEVLRKANYFYKRKQAFQYADNDEVLMEFGRLFPSGKVLYELASILVEQLNGVCFECVHNVLGKKTMRELIFHTLRISNVGCRPLKVQLRAFCCKARGGGGRLRHATERVKKEKKQEKEV